VQSREVAQNNIRIVSLTQLMGKGEMVPESGATTAEAPIAFGLVACG